MKKYLLGIFCLFLVISFLSAEEVMMFTANQYFDSRIYTLSPSGTVQNFFHYENYHFCDMAVVNNELYVAEAFAPRVLKVDLETGDLDVIVDDWSLFYFYDLAFDGTYFYVTEWDLNRYDINGVKNGTASFDEDVFGSTWDGQYLYMLNDNNQIKCWDITFWPNLTEITVNNFYPPSVSCRGLWFDGTYFWSAESLDGSLGYIYQFDYSGQVIDQILAPAWVGFGVCKLDMPVAVDGSTQQDVPTFSISPNPFTDTISMTLHLKHSDYIEYELYDIKGRKLMQLCPGYLSSGTHNFDWNLHDIPPGIYFLEVKNHTDVSPIKILHLSS